MTRSVRRVAVTWALGVAGLLALAGCARQHGLHFDHEPLPVQGARGEGVIAVEVRDLRRVVVSGQKPGCYIGTVASSVGAANDLLNGSNTVRCDALAVSLESDLEEELRQLGFTVGAGGKTLRVEIVEWEFDGFFTGLASYQVRGLVLDRGGEELAASMLRMVQQLPGARTAESRRVAFERLPVLYDAMVDGLLRRNDELLDALL